MVLLISLILAVLPLLGIGWIGLHGSIATVDGLFMSLILLSISGVFGGNALFGLFKGRVKTNGAPTPRPRQPVASGAGELSQRGIVEKVEFFEANVGQTNKSVVTFSGGDPAQFLVFEGDLRNALPAGQKVRISFRRASGYNILTHVMSS